jgi:hypothetical protein
MDGRRRRSPADWDWSLGDAVGWDAQMRVSTELFYAWIYDPAQGQRELWQYLPPPGRRKAVPGRAGGIKLIASSGHLYS